MDMEGLGGKFLLSFCPFPPLDWGPRWEAARKPPGQGHLAWGHRSRLRWSRSAWVSARYSLTGDTLLVGEHHFQGPQPLDLDLNRF